MVIDVRLWAKYHATMPELRGARAALASAACAFLLIGFSTPARYFTASFRRSIALPAIHQLCGHNLVEYRHVWDNSEHLLAQFELFYGFTSHVIHCSRGHFGLPHHMLLNHKQPANRAGDGPLDE